MSPEKNSMVFRSPTSKAVALLATMRELDQLFARTREQFSQKINDLNRPIIAATLHSGLATRRKRTAVEAEISRDEASFRQCKG